MKYKVVIKFTNQGCLEEVVKNIEELCSLIISVSNECGFPCDDMKANLNDNYEYRYVNEYGVDFFIKNNNKS